jgi:hypothetical protein
LTFFLLFVCFCLIVRSTWVFFFWQWSVHFPVTIICEIIWRKTAPKMMCLVFAYSRHLGELLLEWKCYMILLSNLFAFFSDYILSRKFSLDLWNAQLLLQFSLDGDWRRLLEFVLLSQKWWPYEIGDLYETVLEIYWNWCWDCVLILGCSLCLAI